MSYIIAKPDSGPSPFLDAPTIRGNFDSYNTIASTNHIALNQTNQGDHGTVILQNQSTAPTKIVDEVDLYSKDATSNAGTQPQLFVTIPKFLPSDNDTTTVNSSKIPMQLTYNQVNIAGPQYQSFLPGGYLIYFGSFSGVTAGIAATSDTITLTLVPSKLLVAYATFQTLKSAAPNPVFEVATTILSNSQFKVTTLGNNQAINLPYTFTYMAIGTV